MREKKKRIYLTPRGLTTKHPPCCANRRLGSTPDAFDYASGKKGARRGVGTMGNKSHPIGNASGMISLVFALLIEHGEKKKIETEKIVEAESKKLIKINKIKVRKDSSKRAIGKCIREYENYTKLVNKVVISTIEVDIKIAIGVEIMF